MCDHSKLLLKSKIFQSSIRSLKSDKDDLETQCHDITYVYAFLLYILAGEEKKDLLKINLVF